MNMYDTPSTEESWGGIGAPLCRPFFSSRQMRRDDLFQRQIFMMKVWPFLVLLLAVYNWAYLFRNVPRLKAIPEVERLEWIAWRLSSLAYIEIGHYARGKCACRNRRRVGAGTTPWSTEIGLAE
ncbi:MAG: hypothetical protein Q8K23_05230 [Sulfuritalea sp.]|nr:hypothetical protein [Sulfuritalea sp.]